ncbi:hypothetical protein ACTJJ4_07495 [Microbacterium sp. 22195]|uniref:hypothetical protein n=1 Tax=Microbacterium sp. 22195 TaxID=3453891 RepID=UPI003F841FA9
MRSPFQTMTKRFKIEAYADDVSELTVDLSHDDFQAVVKVLHALNQSSVPYTPRFRVSEVDAEGAERRELLAPTEAVR